VFLGLGDVDEDAGQELEGVVVLDGLTALGLIEQELRVRVIAKAGEVHRRPHPITGKFVEPLGVGGIDRSSVVNAKTRVPPRLVKVALGSDELTVSKKSEDFVAEEEFGDVGVDLTASRPSRFRGKWQ
jgi:hypothetical protein